MYFTQNFYFICAKFYLMEFPSMDSIEKANDTIASIKWVKFNY
jgi:hypothetical protein